MAATNHKNWKLSSSVTLAMFQGLHSYVWPVATVLVEVESICIIAAEGSTAQR